MTVHIFEATYSPCCLKYALKSVVRNNFNEFDSATTETVLKSFYADDL